MTTLETRRERDAWLLALEPGDEVVVSRPSWSWPNRSISKVTRVTKTLIIGDTFRVRRQDGRELGNGCRKDRIDPATPETIAAVKDERRRRAALSRITKVKWDDLATDALARVLAIVDEPREDSAL